MRCHHQRSQDPDLNQQGLEFLIIKYHHQQIQGLDLNQQELGIPNYKVSSPANSKSRFQSTGAGIDPNHKLLSPANPGPRFQSTELESTLITRYHHQQI